MFRVLLNALDDNASVSRSCIRCFGLILIKHLAVGWQWHGFCTARVSIKPFLATLQMSCAALQPQPDGHVSLRRSPATLEEEMAPARSGVRGVAAGDGYQDACLQPPEHSEASEEKPICAANMPLAPLGCAPVTIRHAKAALVGSPPPGSMGDPAGLRVWTPAMPREACRPGVPRTACQASSASGSAETPAGIRVGTPAWSAWRRRRDLMGVSSKESGTSGAGSPAGPADGMPAWRVMHDPGRTARAPGDANHHVVAQEAQLAHASMLKRAHSEADPWPAADAQVVGMSKGHTEMVTQRSHGDTGMSVSPSRPAHAQWHAV